MENEKVDFLTIMQTKAMCYKCARQGKVTMFMATSCHYICPLCELKLFYADTLLDTCKNLVEKLEAENAVSRAAGRQPIYEEECMAIRNTLEIVNLLEKNKDEWELKE